MPESRVRVHGRAEPLSIRFHGRKRNFHLATDPIEAQALTRLGPRYKDFLEIAATVFAADSKVTRGGPVRSDMGAGWRRGFRFEVPVRDPGFWSDGHVRDQLVEAASFLTDDDIAFDFIQLDEPPDREPFLKLDPRSATFPAEEVIMFSGGLDSFAGALETLATTDDKVLLVSHRSAQKVIPRQERLGRFLAENYRGRVQHVHVKARRSGEQAVDTNQRSRTLLFTAIGQAVAHAFGARRVNFFENGVVSHNLPISPQVVGSMATRTTHPLALTCLRRLVALLDPDPIGIRTPYQWLTKTEVVERIAHHGETIGATAKIGQAVSCTSVRGQDTLRTHCGACSQCLDRRFAILAAGLEGVDPTESYATDVMLGPRDTQHSRVMSVEWTRHMRRLGQLDQRALITTFGTELSRILAGHGDRRASEVLADCLDLYRRQSQAVRAALQRALTGNAVTLVDDGIAPTSLLGMILGDGTEATEPAVEAPRTPLKSAVSAATVEERDEWPSPDAPLVVAFSFDERQRYVVEVRALARLLAGPAAVAHGLKGQFDIDRSEGRMPEEHRYVRPERQPILSGMTKALIRQNIARCRKQLAEAFKQMHGNAPNDHLLIQTRPQGRDYRLDPTIEVVTAARIADD